MVRTRRRRQQGAAFVEAAIGFCVLIFMVFGAIETSLLFQDHELLYNITREATRRMVVGDTVGTAKTKALQWNTANTNFTASTVTLVVQQSSDQGQTWSSSLGDTAQAVTSDWVRVTGSYSHKGVTGFFGSRYNLPATVIMRVEKGS